MREIIARLEEIPDGGSIRKEVNGIETAIFRKGGELHAIDAVCPHRRGPLDGADIEDDYIAVCPWHGWRFDIRTGKSPTHPGQVSCFPVEAEDGDVYITLDYA